MAIKPGLTTEEKTLRTRSSIADGMVREMTCCLIPMKSFGHGAPQLTQGENDEWKQPTETYDAFEAPSTMSALIAILRSLFEPESIHVRMDDNSTPSMKAKGRLSLISSLPKDYTCMINILVTLVPGDFFAFKLQAPSDTEALAALNFVASLDDEYYTRIQISHGPFHDKLRHAPPLFGCPFSPLVMTRLLSNETRETELSFYSFSVDQTRLLLSHDAKYRLKLNHCQLNMPNNMQSIRGCGPIRLTICFGDSTAAHGQNLFCCTEKWIEFLKVLDLERLQMMSLCEGLVQIAVCDQLCELSFRHLELHHVKLEDGGSSLVASAKRGVGPRGLSLVSPLFVARRIFRAPYQWSNFFSNLRGNRNIERLVLDGNTLQQIDWSALVDALKENLGLRQLRISYGLYITSECWTELMAAISVHPTLGRLFFEIIVATPGWNDPSSILHRTDSLARLLRSNRRIYDIGYSFSFDKQAWDENVAPELRQNLFIRRYAKLQEMDCPTQRAIAVSASLAAVHKDPKLLWLALSMNQDLISHLQVQRGK